MIRDITLGQYHSADSFVHHLDPRVKIRFVIAFLLLILFDRNLPLYIMLTVLFLAALFLSKVPVRKMLKGMCGVFIFFVLCAAISIFTTYGTVVLRIGALNVTQEGLVKFGFVCWRLLLMIFFSSLLMYTTTPTELTDGFEKCFHLSPSVAMGMTIALRFLPVIFEETDRVIKAREVRGGTLHSGKLSKRFRDLRDVLLPVFQNALDRAANLADAMEARCYTGGKGRTRLKPITYKAADLCAYLVLLAVVVAGIYFIVKF